MLKKAAALLLVCASTAIWVSCGAVSSNYLYMTIPGSNEIVIYREDPNSGILTQLAGSPITAGSAVESLVIHPNKKLMFAANTGESDVSMFTIAASGAITEITPRTVVGTAPTILAMDAAGQYLYVGNSLVREYFSFFYQCDRYAADTDPGCRLSFFGWTESHQYGCVAVGKLSLCDRHRIAWVRRSV